MNKLLVGSYSFMFHIRKCQNNLNIQKNLKQFYCYIISVTLAIQEVGSHEQFQCDLRSDGEFGYFCGAVGVTDLVGEVHADLR